MIDKQSCPLCGGTNKNSTTLQHTKQCQVPAVTNFQSKKDNGLIKKFNNLKLNIFKK